ncbi:interleukin-like EMT inducer domain-containing protein [Lactococcus cremoris]|uniref:interleukin-like EMT inducer domain-containing protein n=1 Tax=Lactococcus lactis subsp. cremoris TaxID=1359 RepID=UPI0007AE9FE0|nr:interleukin-like EMT inducer domain-containing protein [Lactococcus cremoris]KZK49798.1 Phage tail assembly [Lactococcus cremoris]
MQLNIHDSTLKRVGFINNNLPDALHYFDDNWHRYLAEGTSTFDFSVNKINSSYALLTLKSYISFTYDGEDYLFNIINIEQDHYSMHLQCENLNLELISEEVGAYGNTKRHSIVWYLKNVAKITDDFVEIGNNPFPLNDEDSSNPILSFDSTDTKLARIISICNSFNAEFQFRTQLKNDGTLQNITIDLYKEEGVGQKRKDVTLYYGKNIAGITSKADRTSTFFNATTVTDSKNKFNWLSVEGKHYNSDGQLEFYKNAGDNTAYAPLSRDMFPSQLKSSSSDRYTRKNLSIEATSANGLWDYAVSQFKLYAYPQMTYEVVVSVNAVTSALGNDKKLNIGDTIIVQDSTFDKSDGGLILSARVSQQEISFTNPLNNKITFTNFVKLKSEISADLYGRMKDLVDQNTPYKAEVETTNGLQFKNGKGSTTLTARIYFGSDSTETKADSYSWTKDGTLVADVQEITVDASGVSDKAVYSFKATVGGKVVASQSVTITNVNDGERGPQGLKGDPGATGKDGRAGKDGVGIKTTVITYAISTSGTTAPNTSWTSQVPTLVKGLYLWTKTVWTYTDNSSETGYSATYIAKDGNNGNDGIAGKDGVGIKKTTITYASHTNGTTAPASGWNSQVPNVPAGQYLWTKTVWDYTDKTSETGYSVAMMGVKGDKGDRGIQGLQGPDGTQGIPGPKGVDAPMITVKSYTFSAGSRAEIELTGPNAFKKTVYSRGHNIWVIDATTHKLKEFVNCDTYTTMSFSHNGVSTTLADYLNNLKDSIVVIAASDAYAVDQNFRDVLNSMGGFPDLGTWVHWRVGHVFIGMSKRNDGTWPLQPRQGYEVAISNDGIAPEIGCTLSKGGIVAKGADGKTQYTHIAYANSSDGNKDFSTYDSNRTYIGMYVNFKIDDSTTPSDYSWTLVKGADGTQGTPGKPGTDGKTPYFHTAWSNSADGTLNFNPDYKSAVGLDVLNITNWAKNFPMSHSTYNFVINTDSSFKVTGKGTGGFELLSKTFPAKVGDKLRFTVRYTNRQEFGKYDGYGLQFVAHNEYTESFDMSSKIVLPNTITEPEEYQLEYTATTNNVWMGLNFGNVEDLSEVDFDIKIEVENLTNPVKYMYIGTYSDYTATDSTKPTAYTWSLIRGNDGKDGATGPQGPTGPAGSNGNPGKVVSDTEPTTKFKGLTWKYSGVVDMTLGDGTKILAGTEYYWNGTVWALYEINAHNINGDNLSVTNGTFKDGKIESVWGNKDVNGTTSIKGSHLQIYSSNSTTNTENTVEIDNLQGYSQVYTDHNTGRTITVQASFQGFFVSDSTGPYVRVTPNGISTSSDKSYDSLQIGAGITISLERRGDIVEARLSGSINYPLTTNTKFGVGTIPFGYRPNTTAYIMVNMTSSTNSSHIDVEPDGTCIWWGSSTHNGAPRGHQMWFTNDTLKK